jgi:hypothetical protein
MSLSEREKVALSRFDDRRGPEPVPVDTNSIHSILALRKYRS